MTEGEFMVKYTNKDIMEKLEQLDKISQEILEHSKITNGRVTNLERKSVGMWISNNPVKFTLFVIMFIAIVISDFRHPIMELIRNFMGFV